MAQYKNKKSFFSTFFLKDKLVALGTVVFIGSLVLMMGMFLFPTVRKMLHGSALAIKSFPGFVMTNEPLPVALPPFKDVDFNHPNAEAINYLESKRMVKGYSDGTFKPENSLTRAEFLKFLFEAQKIYPSPAVYRACFKDAKDDWFAPYVCYAKAKGFVQGRDATFGPAAKITVLEALKIILLSRHTDLLQGSSFADMQIDAEAWYAPYISTSLAKKLITWDRAGGAAQQVPNLSSATLTKALLTRGQAAEILYRMMN